MGIVDNISNEDFVVEKGTRLFQICPPLLNNPINLSLVDELTDSERGQGGLGSTG
jgi:dUTPase